jgi:dihydroflavonol-4-reductase
VNVLLTGATGFLGVPLARRLVADGHDVRALRRPTSDVAPLADLDIEWITGDVTDPAGVAAAVAGREWVVHAAVAATGERRTQMSVNVTGTRLLAEASLAAGVRRFLHVSSIAAIGIPTNGRAADERHQFNLSDPPFTYHVSKHRAEAEVLSCAARGLDAVLVNPANIFGPDGEGYRAPPMVARVRRQRFVPVYSGGACLVHLNDVVDGIIAALLRGVSGERYILGGENVTYRELARRSAHAMGLRRMVVSVPPLVTGPVAAILEPMARLAKRRPKITREVHVLAARRMFYDSSKAGAELGYAPRGAGEILHESIAPSESRSVAPVAEPRGAS